MAVKKVNPTFFAGSANINGGVTVDMRSIKGLDVSQDHKFTSIGAGECWSNVYRKLDAMSLFVSGEWILKPRVARPTTGDMSISVNSKMR